MSQSQTEPLPHQNNASMAKWLLMAPSSLVKKTKQKQTKKKPEKLDIYPSVQSRAVAK